MTVQELIDQLMTLTDRDKRIVVQSIDSEGNSIRNTHEFSVNSFRQDGSWDGELLIEPPLTPELEGQGYTDEDIGTADDIPCVCFWPVN